MTCNTFNCIYVIECQGCFKMYIGETNNLRLRINLHRDHAKKNTGLGVSKHIFSCSIKLNFPFKVMPFYKMSTDDSTIRRRMEEHFINKFKPELNKWINALYLIPVTIDTLIFKRIHFSLERHRAQSYIKVFLRRVCEPKFRTICLCV